jgi:hypothetical protein
MFRMTTPRSVVAAGFQPAGDVVPVRTAPPTAGRDACLYKVAIPGRVVGAGSQPAQGPEREPPPKEPSSRASE